MKINREKGVIIVFVVIIVGIIGLLYASLYFLISADRKMQKTLEDSTKAYYIAEAGLEKAYAYMRATKEENIKTDTPFTMNNPFKTEEADGTKLYQVQHSAVYTITNTPPSYTIVCEGKYGNSVRRLEARVVKNSDELEIQYWKEIN